MDYLMTFLEGFLSFISPCVLPMVPIYITYLIGDASKTKETTKTDETDEDVNLNKDKITDEDIKEEKTSNKRLYLNSLFFILGFTIVFMLLGVFSSAIGGVLVKYKTYINIGFGVILLILGLNFLGVLKIGFLNKEKKIKKEVKSFNTITSFVFGLLFAAGWTPCVGPFLASAMIRAADSGTILNGVILLLLYALGIGIPFFLSAVFLAQLQSTFNFIKKHYDIINKISGVLIIILGILKIFGIF